MLKRKFFNLFCFCGLVIAALLIFTGCSTKPDYYGMADFAIMQKIDTHVHVNSLDPAFVEQAIADNFKLLTINTDYPDFPPIEVQQKDAITLQNKYPGRIAYASTFHMTGWDSPDWQEKTIAHLDSTFEQGAIAVKVWKNIGMAFRDKNGNLVMINNPKFDKIFNHLHEVNIPLIGHMGEPKNCWLPIEEMTVNNDKGYFKHHPQYHMYLHPEMPSYEEQMAVRDSMLEKHRDMVFMGAHLASLEWSVDVLAKFLDHFPKAVVDMAARSGQVQYQSSRDREKVRQFFIKYQDRILYATDITQEPDANPEEFRNEVHNKWVTDWKYMNTDSTMQVPELDEPFQGLKLPRKVIDKVYRLNAEKTFPKAWKVKD